MRVAVAALVLPIAALTAGLLVQRSERAAADYNVTGSWTFYAEGEPPCPADIIETKEGVLSEVMIEITFQCDPPSNVCGFGCLVSGALNRQTGFFQLTTEPYTFLTVVSGTIMGDGHAIEGNFLNYCVLGCIPPPGFRSLVPYTATGGNGDPKLGTATTVPTTSTPAPVGGGALDAPSSGSGPLEAWWLVAIVGTAFAALGGAVHARRLPR